jgi:hypothetical protein
MQMLRIGRIRLPRSDEPAHKHSVSAHVGILRALRSGHGRIAIFFCLINVALSDQQQGQIRLNVHDLVGDIGRGQRQRGLERLLVVSPGLVEVAELVRDQTGILEPKDPDVGHFDFLRLLFGGLKIGERVVVISQIYIRPAKIA